jgi:hypothetical protein
MNAIHHDCLDTRPMIDISDNAVPKIHPATREILPEDPLELQAFQVPGDTERMLRLLVEEFARIGWGVEPILALARDPNYLAFHGLWRLYGEDRLRRRVSEILARCGVVHVKSVETCSRDLGAEQLVQIVVPS